MTYPFSVETGFSRNEEQLGTNSNKCLKRIPSPPFRSFECVSFWEAIIFLPWESTCTAVCAEFVPLGVCDNSAPTTQTNAPEPNRQLADLILFLGLPSHARFPLFHAWLCGIDSPKQTHPELNRRFEGFCTRVWKLEYTHGQ